MPALKVSRSATIDAPIDKVYSVLSDFNHWRPWSPWLISDPEASQNTSDDGRYNEWEGERAGSGNMRIVDEQKNKFIDYDLAFLKPWKSKAKTRFELKKSGSGTEITWLMDSSLPWFMFWMKKMMTAIIGMDYERGLSMLKEYVEDGKVHSTLDFVGVNHFEGCEYIGINTATNMDELGPKMASDFEALWNFVGGDMDMIAGQPFSIYHKWDIVGKKIDYTSGIPIISIPTSKPSSIISGNILPTSVYTLRHIGPYHHLGNGWGTLHNMGRSKEFMMNKKIDPFETYVNKPTEVSDKELITDIHFPIK